MHNFKSKNILITGAAGFIGSHLAEVLLAKNATVYGVDNLLTGSLANLAHLQSNHNFHFRNASVIEVPESYLPSNVQFDFVFHFASPASPVWYQRYPVETYLVNSLGTHCLQQYLVTTNPKAVFVFAGTSEAYGDPLEHPQTESYWGNVNPNGVRSCYDEAKRLGETICGVHFRDFGLDSRIVRIFNTYGPRMNPKDGRVIPQFVTAALQGVPLTVYGDGSQTRSYCYIDDLVEGILRLAAYENLAGETVNIGNTAEFTVAQTAELVKQVTRSQSTIEYLPLPVDDPTRRQPDISKARKLLAWEPTISLAEGLLKSVSYFKSQLT